MAKRSSEEEEKVIYKMQYPYANAFVKSLKVKCCSWGPKRTLSDLDPDVRGK